MSYRCAFKLSLRWGILGTLIGYAVIAVVNAALDHPLHYDRLNHYLNDSEIPYLRLPNVSGWVAPIGAFLPLMILAFITLVADELQSRRRRRSEHQWQIDTHRIRDIFRHLRICDCTGWRPCSMHFRKCYLHGSDHVLGTTGLQRTRLDSDQ